ncbi:MAG: hypothetical protein A3C53_08465 [Omnitrophica WOR_2 bacterium RIFCSPHIGHO2_02_FULL_68_15]|nr:MAG: hypothetical protein A3C53_08465 [Omnitrophica WOR_2 bacterium RIFCSPHIGHO2_02_FULL_68_15]
MNLYALSSLIAATFCCGLALFVYSKSRGNAERRAFAAVTFLIGIWTLFPYLAAQAPDPVRALQRSRLVYVAALCVPSLFFQFMLHTMRMADEPRERRLLRASYGLAIGFAACVFSPMFIRAVVANAPYSAVVPGPLYLAFILYFGYMYFHASHRLWPLYRRSTGHFREHLRYIGLAFILAFLAGVMHFASAFRIPEIIPHDLLVISYSAIIAFAIIRYRIMDLRVAVARTMILAAVYAVLLGLPFAALRWYRDPLSALVQQHVLAAPALAVVYALFASCCPFVYIALQRRVADRLLAEQRRYQTVLRQAAQGMTLIKEMDKLLNLIVHILTRTVRISHSAVYLLDKDAKTYVLRARRGTLRIEVGYTIPVGSPLIAELIRQKGAIVQEEMKLQLQSGGETASLVAAEGAMGTIQAAVAVPSFVEDKLIGFLVLGEKHSGRAYSEDDLQVFEVLASQAALAIENAQFYDELQRTQADLFQTAKMATLGQMAGGMSHQINNRFYVLTILAGTMKAALDALTLEGVAPAVCAAIGKAKETFQKVEDNAIRGGDIVKTLLRFSRPTRGDQKPVSIQEIVDTALDVVQYKIKLEDLDVAKEYEPDLPLVQGNVNQLADSLFNLFSNAYDAIQSRMERLKPPDYRGAIVVRARAVAGRGRVELTIRDNGIGMSPQEVGQLFIPFFTTKATSEKGTGLGLFIIKRIVEHHGGQIQATSQFGEGTTFTITLPAAPPAA